MTHEQNLSYIHSAVMNIDDQLSARCWAVFFKEKDTGNYICYDAPDPVKTYKAIAHAHPNYTFVGVRPCDSQATVIEYAKALRLCAKLIPVIKKCEETLLAASTISQTQPLAQPRQAA